MEDSYLLNNNYWMNNNSFYSKVLAVVTWNSNCFASSSLCTSSFWLFHHYIMNFIQAALVLVYFPQYCQCHCGFIDQTKIYHLAANRVLLNHVFQWKTLSSPVICGRDCSTDPQCASFNYHNSFGHRKRRNRSLNLKSIAT